MLLGGTAAFLVGLSLLVRRRQRAIDTDPALEELRQASACGDLSAEESQTRRERVERDR